MFPKRFDRALIVGSGLAILLAGLRVASAGDWPFYRHDSLGTSNAGEPLTLSQAQGFSIKWSVGILPIGNPVVAGGTVFVTAADGALHAIDAASGTQRWAQYSKAHGPFHCFPTTTSASTRGPVGAPAVVGAVVYQPGGDGTVYAYDAATGAIRWQTQIADVPTRGEFLWSSAFPVAGRILVGVSSLHDCLLVPGRVAALDQATGQLVATWWADANHGPGGGVWTQPAFDARTNRVFLTTGTIAPGKTAAEQPLADAFVAFDATTMQTVDHFTPISGNYYDDLDFGTSPVLYDTLDGRHLIAATNKNGFVYALNRDALAAGLLWTYQISASGVSPDVGESSIASPAYAGGRLFVGGGKTPDGHAGAFAALDAATGLQDWLVHPPNGGFILAAPTVAGDTVIFGSTHALGAPATLYVVSQSAGNVVYSMDTPGAIFSEPTYANGALYFGDLQSSLWALVPGGAAPPPQTFSDDFERTGGLGSNWIVAHGGFTTDGHAALGTASQSYAFYVGDPGASSTVAVRITAPVTTYVGVTARGVAGAPDRDHYAAYVAPDGSIGLARRNGYSYAYLGSAPKIAAGAHELALAVAGASPVSLSVRLDGTEVIQFNDRSSQSLSSGLGGMFDYDGKSQPIDQFSINSTGVVTPPGGTTIASDEFTGADALGSSWTTWSGGFTVASGAASSTARLSYATFGAAVAGDVTVSATVTPANGMNYSGVLARASAASGARDHYAAWINVDGSVHVARRNQWSYSYLADATPALTGAHKLTLKVQGSGPVHLSLLVDNNPVLDVMDGAGAALTSAGTVGLFSWQGAGPRFQHFAATQP